MRRLSLLAVLLTVIAATGHAQSQSDRSQLSAIVLDQTGAAIAGARVELIAENIPQQSATTDQSGGFSFKRVPPARYQVRVTSEGFEPLTIDVNVGPQPPAPLRIFMAVANVHLETTVTSGDTQVGTEAGENQDSVALSEQSLSNLPVFD